MQSIHPSPADKETACVISFVSSASPGLRGGPDVRKHRMPEGRPFHINPGPLADELVPDE
ncbi:hypothetical protein [Variovorax sp. 770b2]|uniref:hypothetical protein n=1 Tax=Variovorax sp. 770b2 TaxID=1566271 RepID=UPI001160DD15|nr:hypothetical protein [Variovorax sp. 770b2]